jgi:VanZ family protein
MRFAKWLPPVIWAAVILSASNDLFSAGNTSSWMNRVAGHEVPDLLNHAFRKGGHIAGYAALAFLGWLADRRILRPLLFALAVATVDETLQSFTRLRAGSAFDVMLDGASAALLLLICERVRYARASSHEKITIR